MTSKGHAPLVVPDVVRIYAALSVAIFHLAYWNWFPENSTPKSVLLGATSFPELLPLSWFGWIGVHIFFTLSGFVIACTTEGRSESKFAIQRFLRLFPTAVVCATITLVIAFAADWRTEHLMGMYLRAITFSFHGPYIDSVYWTLAIEICFYLYIAAAVATRKSSAVEIAINALGVTISTLWIGNALIGGDFSIPFKDDISSRNLQLLLVEHGIFFAVGGTVWFGATKGWTFWRLSSAIFFFAVAAYTVRHHAAAQMAWMVCAGSLALTIYAEPWLRRAIGAARWLRLLALATYPLYLLHQVAGNAVLRWLVLFGINRFVALAITLALFIAASVFIASHLDPAVRRLGLRLMAYTKRPSQSESSGSKETVDFAR